MNLNQIPGYIFWPLWLAYCVYCLWMLRTSYRNFKQTRGR